MRLAYGKGEGRSKQVANQRKELAVRTLTLERDTRRGKKWKGQNTQHAPDSREIRKRKGAVLEEKVVKKPFSNQPKGVETG